MIVKAKTLGRVQDIFLFSKTSSPALGSAQNRSFSLG